MTPDTVEGAARDGELLQPYADLGLRTEEYQRIRGILGRRPTGTELAMYSVMWSEHCSYKSSKVHLRQFAEKAPPAGVLLAGIGENAGVVDVGGGVAVTFKVESHNHPSFVEPYQGAATGVGGIVRDILTMGARPVAVMDSLRFGDAGAPETARLLPAVVAGVGGYGNCLGLPNIGGELAFDPSYDGNPLVNALCVGVLPSNRIQHSLASGPGNAVVLLGARTGRDGIGGVSVLASATFDDSGAPAKRPSVQVGDPFVEKLLIECCLEMFDRGLVTGIQDLGGAGLSCGLSETASHARTGMDVELETVPLREVSMDPLEVLTSESQERMLAIVEPRHLAEVHRLASRWGVPSTTIGTVTDTGRLRITWHGDLVADVPPDSLADDGPVYDRATTRPGRLDAVQADAPTGARIARPATGAQLRAALSALLASPDLCSRRWVTEQYDRYVQGNTVLAMPADAGVVRLADHGRGVALALDGNGRYGKLDPYAGAQLALAEAYRNVAVTGARPLAVTNCLNFGSPEDPEVMWEFARAVSGLADGAAELGTPVTGGNVSFYNSTGTSPIHPTTVVGVLGVLDDVALLTPLASRSAGDVVFVLGDTRDEFGGSAWAWVVHRHLGGFPPTVDLTAERRLAQVLAAGSSERLFTGAHDVSDGGLGIALAEMCLQSGLGADITVATAADPFVALFSESTARAIVAAAPANASRVAALADAAGVPVRRLGALTAEPLLRVGELFDVALDELREMHEGTLPALFG